LIAAVQLAAARARVSRASAARPEAIRDAGLADAGGKASRGRVLALEGESGPERAGEVDAADEVQLARCELQDVCADWIGVL